MAFIKGSFLQQGSKVSAFSSTRYIIYIAQKFCEVIVGTEALSVLLMVEVEETNKGLRELLEMLMDNIGEQVHRQVIDTGILPILVKIVKKKVDHSLLTELPCAGVQFPQRPRERPSNHQAAQESKKITLNGELAAARHEAGAHPAPLSFTEFVA
ncbi:hypothetical protein SADUNF_Sadunf19G0022600 [Salix dunnii]|uniref:Uncharacterized protein n=1 Tax=Salix dunnii TaxID=1413687 RepID=A0A835J0N1_9ROSI|nr:hypothetical protein SADUNF_Sadunf19G0020900 [Salix dunnii]KAF9661003.1 hypothetical protein SADUNF_Sadunf19G0022600 [Salix dunnii]